MKKNRPESCGVGRLLFKAFVSVVLLLAALRIGRLRAEHDRCNGKSHRCGRAACRRRQRRGRGDVHGYDHGGGVKARGGVGGSLSVACPSACPYPAVPVTVTLESESTMIEQAVVYPVTVHGQNAILTGSIVNVDAATIANSSGVEPAGLVAGPRGRCADHQFGSGRTGSRNPYPRYELDQRLRTALCGDGMFTDNINYLNAK